MLHVPTHAFPSRRVFDVLLFIWGGGVLACGAVSGDAARVSPRIVDIKPLGRGSDARIELSNPGQVEFPVEVQMFRGVISETGELELTPADDQFLLFPTQIVVPARSQQVFRVQYIGEPALAASEIYYMQIRQIPVEIAPEIGRATGRERVCQYV